MKEVKKMKEDITAYVAHCQEQPERFHENPTLNVSKTWWVNSLRPRQNGRHFPDDNFKWIFLNENVWILIKISLKFVPRGRINNIPALVQIMAWHWPDDKPFSEIHIHVVLVGAGVTGRPFLVFWMVHFTNSASLSLYALHKIQQHFVVSHG